MHKNFVLYFDKVDGLIRNYDDPKFMIGLDILQDQKTALHRFFSHNPAKIKIYSYDDLLLKETITLHYVVTY